MAFTIKDQKKNSGNNAIYHHNKRIKYLKETHLRRQKTCGQKSIRYQKKEITDDANRWRNMPCSQKQRINILKIAVLSKLIYRFNSIISNCHWHFSQN